MGGVIQHMDWGVEGENVRWNKGGAPSRQHWCNTVLHGNREEFRFWGKTKYSGKREFILGV